MNGFSFRRKNSGFSFVELAVAFAVLGAAALLLSHLASRQAVATQRLMAHSQLERAQDALYAFARLNGRFPCVATSREGMENCHAEQEAGLLPFVTIGLPEISPIGYEVSTTAPALTGEESTFFVLTANGVLAKSEGPTPKNEILSSLLDGDSRPRLLDLCALLAKDGASNRAAFNLSARSDLSQSDTPKIQHLSVSRVEAAGELNCGRLVGAARAHFNVLLASAVMQRGASDGIAQLKERNQLNDWYSDQADYSEAMGAFALTHSILTMPNSFAKSALEQIKPEKALSDFGFAIAGAVISGIALGVTSSNLVRFHEMGERAEKIFEETKANKDELALIDASIRERALRSARRTYFFEPSL